MGMVAALNTNTSSSINHTKDVTVHPPGSLELICIISPVLPPHSQTGFCYVSSLSQTFFSLLAYVKYGLQKPKKYNPKCGSTDVSKRESGVQKTDFGTIIATPLQNINLLTWEASGCFHVY